MSAAKNQNVASATKRVTGEAKMAAEGHGESFGAYLIRSRELRGVSLEQIADETRILASKLKALEEDDRSNLPERVFVVGYIRAYAKAIGLDANEAILRYDEYLQSRESQPPVTAIQLPRGERRFGTLSLIASILAVVIAVAVCLSLALGGTDSGAVDSVGAPETDETATLPAMDAAKP